MGFNMTEELKDRPTDSTDTVTNFPKLMQDLDAGVLSNVMGLALSNVTRAVINSNKQGTVSLTFKIKPGSSTATDFVNIVSNIKINEPKTNYGSKIEDFQYESVAFVGFGGKMTYDRPKQDINNQLSIVDDGEETQKQSM